MRNILKHNSTEGAINGDLFIKSGKDIFLDATIIEDVFTNGQIDRNFSISSGVKFAHCLKIKYGFKQFGEKNREKKCDGFPSLNGFPYGTLNELNDKTIQEGMDELDNMNNIFDYNSTEGAINGDLFIKSGKYIYFRCDYH